ADRDGRERFDGGVERGIPGDHRQVGIAVGAVEPRKLLLLAFLPVEELDQVNTVDALVQEGVQIRQPRSHLPEGAAHLSPEGERYPDQERHDGEGYQGEVQVHPEHDADDPGQKHDVADNRDDPGGKHLPEHLDVAGQAGDQAAGRRPVEKRGGKPLHVGEEFNPDVLHDPLAEILEQPDLQKGKQRFCGYQEEEVEREYREASQVTLDDMVVYGELDQPGLGEFGSRGQREDQEDRDHKPDVGTEVPDKAEQKPPVVGLADYFIFIDAVRVHSDPLFFQLASNLLLLVDSRIAAAEGQEFPVASFFDNSAFIQVDDRVAVPKRGEPVGNYDYGFPGSIAGETGEDILFGLCVYRRKRIVKYQDGRVFQDRPGDGSSLFLAAGEGYASFTDHARIAVGEASHIIMEAGKAGSLTDLLPGCSFPAERNIGCDTAGKEEAFLRDKADGIPEIGERKSVDVDAVDEDGSVRSVIEAGQQFHQGRLPCADRTYYSQGRSCRDGEGDSGEHRIGAVREAEVAELDLPGYRIRDDRISWLFHRRIRKKDLVQSRHGGGPALDQVENPPHDDGRPDQHHEIAAERHEIAQGQDSFDHLLPSVYQDYQRSERSRGGHDRDHETSQPRDPHIAFHVVTADLGKLLHASFFPAVCLDNGRCGDVLLHGAGKTCQLFLC